MRKLFKLLLASVVLFFCFTLSKAQLTGTSYSDDFEGSLASGWSGNSNIVLDQSGGVLNMDVSTRNKWIGQYLSLGGSADISSKPYATFKVKTSEPVLLTIYVFSASGGNLPIHMKVNKVDEFINLCVDFSAFSNLTDINAMQWTCNGATTGWTGTLTIDDLELGTTATKMANIGGVANQVRYVGSKSQTLLFTDIDNADDLSISGGGSLIENTSFSAITDGVATLTFDCIDGQSGTDQITITANGSTGFANNTYVFDLEVEDNKAPAVDDPADVNVATTVPKTVQITGISDGNSSVEQSMVVSAVSDNQTAIPNGNISVNYVDGSPNAEITFTADQAADDVTITVTVDDQQSANNTASVDFLVDAFDSYNNEPTLNDIAGQSVYESDGQQSIILSGIGDGDGGGQDLSFIVTSDNQSVVTDASLSIGYVQGESVATLYYAPEGLGDAMITVTLTDDGGDGSNNGDASVVETFFITVRQIPPKGYEVTFDDFDADTASGEIRIEGLGSKQIVTYETKDTYDAMKIEAVNKGIWNGTWWNNFMLNLEEHPYVSMDVYADEELLVWLWFWDYDTAYSGNSSRGKRNNSFNTKDYEMVETVPAGVWTHLVFDFSYPGGMEDNNGTPLKTDEIVYVLMNWHNAMQTGPSQPPEYSGNIWFANVKVGDKAEGVAVKTPYCTIDDVSDQVHIQDAAAEQDTIFLTGISDGNETMTGVNVSVSTSNASVADPSIIDIQPDGTAKLIYTPQNTTGAATIDITVDNSGISYDYTISFDISVVSNNTLDAEEISVNLGSTFQTMRGFGAKYGSAHLVDAYAKDLGSSAVRIGIIGNQIEPENDNNDPYVLNRDNLNYDAFDWEYFRKLKAAGVETFILTSWSPPAWMKTNHSESYFQGSANKNANNKLEKYYYEEMAESFVAAIKMFKEECDIDIYAIGPQNEPFFCEPYPSAVMTGQEFADLVEVIGERFDYEGLSTKIFMPEEVFSQKSSLNDYVTTLLADTEADSHADIFAVHNYATDGIGEGSGTATDWSNLLTQAQSGSPQKEVWMTETGSNGNDWDGALRMVQGISDAMRYGDLSLWCNWSFTSTTEDYGFYVKGKPARQFYAAKNFYKFIKPGAQKVETTLSDVDLMVNAAKNDAAHGDHLAIVIINKADVAKSITLNVTGGTAPTDYEIYRTTYNDKCIKLPNTDGNGIIALPAKSVTTLYGIGTAYTLTVVSGEGGGDYPSNSEVLITADPPAVDYEFLEWTGDDVTQYVEDPFSATTKVYMPDMDYTVTANYKQVQKYTLTVNNGSGDGDYQQGVKVIVAADAPHADSLFNGWAGDIQYLDNALAASTQITMPGAPATISATYRAKTAATYLLTVNSGTIDNTGGQDTASFIEGATASITADAIANKTFDHWEGDVSALDDANSATATVTMPNSAVTVTAVYLSIYDLIVSGGLIQSSGAAQGKFFETDQEIIVADDRGDCFEFVGWTGDVSALDDPALQEATVTMPAAHVSFTAEFVSKEYARRFILFDEQDNTIPGVAVAIDGDTTIVSNSFGIAEHTLPDGTYDFTVSYADHDTVTGTLTFPCADTTISITLVPSGTGIISNQDMDIVLYPNPANNVVNIDFGGANVSGIMISDVSGRLVRAIEVAPAAELVQVSIDAFTAGIYMVSVNTEKGVFRTQLIIE